MTLREKHQQGKFTITVELDPPKSSSAEKTFEQAARLKGRWMLSTSLIALCPKCA